MENNCNTIRIIIVKMQVAEPIERMEMDVPLENGMDIVSVMEKLLKIKIRFKKWVGTKGIGGQWIDQK